MSSDTADIYVYAPATTITACFSSISIASRAMLINWWNLLSAIVET